MKCVKTARFALLALPLLLCMSYAKADAVEVKKAKTIDEMREAMLGVWFEIEVPAPAEGPRVWLLPHVFGDVCLHLPGATRLRIKAQNVRKLWDWIHATGQVQ